MSLRFSALVCEVPGGIRNLKTNLQKKEQKKKKKSQSVVLPVCTHLPAECTLWQGCCRRPGRLRCRQPPGSGTESRWSGLSANSSWSPGCWCSSPGSPPATPPDGTCGRTNTIQLLAWSLKILHSNKVLSTVRANEEKSSAHRYYQPLDVTSVAERCETRLTERKVTWNMAAWRRNKNHRWHIYISE